MQIQSVTRFEGSEKLEMSCVGGKAPYGAEGQSEDNTFARWSPSGGLNITISNPELIGKFKPGEKFYLDFTKAAE